MSRELKACIEYWEQCPEEDAIEDVALTFIYLADRLERDRRHRGQLWTRLSRRVIAWNKRIDEKK